MKKIALLLALIAVFSVVLCSCGAGEKILYCAESRCFHEHSNSLKTVWHRGLDIGAFHAQYPELQRDFGTLAKCAKNHIPLKIKLRYFFQLAVKYLAFRYGYVSFRRK